MNPTRFVLILMAVVVLFLVAWALGHCAHHKPGVTKAKTRAALIKPGDLDTNLANNHYSEANSRFAKDYVKLLRKTRRSVAQQRKEGPNHG